MVQEGGLSVLSERDQDKILRLAAPAFLPILTLRREQAVSKLIGLYHAGGDLRSATAEIATYETLIHEFKIKLTQGE